MLSPDGSHFAVVFRDPGTSALNVSLYEIGVGEKWTKEVNGYSDVSMDNNNWVYVTSNDGQVLYNTNGTEITRWGTSGYYIDSANDGSRCVVHHNSKGVYAYDFVDVYECYPDLHMQAYITDVVPYDADTKKYTLTIANWYDVPPELFIKSPELPACGLNYQAGRTYIRIFGSEGSFYFSGCAGGDGTSSEFLKNISVYIDDDEQLDQFIYLELWDRKCDLYLHSTYADSGQPCPVGDLDGNCIVNLRDFALMAENWLVDNNP